MGTYQDIIDQLTVEADTKIIFFIMDGLGGLHMDDHHRTELETARTPNLDQLAGDASCGLLIPVDYGITPGSGPAHFALFGYDPIESNLGRGVLEAAGIGFELTEQDLAVRGNFATVDKEGNVIDRRAGRISTEENQQVCEKLREKIRLEGVDVFIQTIKEHRFLLVLRGDALEDGVCDTDPQETGVPALDPQAARPDAEKSAHLLKEFIRQARHVLSDESRANMLTLRGAAKHRRYKSMKDRYKLRSLCIANYPMYRGVSALIGMDLHPVTSDLASQFQSLQENFHRYDFIFFHVKTPDKTGEDGDFDAKVKAIEVLDSFLPQITGLNPDVLVITGDHSTPSVLRSHSWHSVPVLLHSRYARKDEAKRLSESEALKGALGQIQSKHIMPLALAHALRLKKFGA